MLKAWAVLIALTLLAAILIILMTMEAQGQGTPPQKSPPHLEISAQPEMMKEAIRLTAQVTTQPVIIQTNEPLPPTEQSFVSPATNSDVLSPVAQPANPQSHTAHTLGSIAGISAIAVVLVDLMKRSLSNISYFARIDVRIYGFVIAGILAYLANQVLTMNGRALLPGDNVWDLVIAAGISTVMSSGLYTIIQNLKHNEPITPGNSVNYLIGK